VISCMPVGVLAAIGLLLNCWAGPAAAEGSSADQSSDGRGDGGMPARLGALGSALGLPAALVMIHAALGAVESDVIAAGPLEEGGGRGRYGLYRELVVVVNRLAVDDPEAARARAR
jgi:hypothetical protein